MAIKPAIVYIGGGSSDIMGQDVDCLRDAQIYFMEKLCGCDVLVYDYIESFEKDTLIVRKLISSGRILLFVVIQDRHTDEHNRIIELIRVKLCATTHICVTRDPLAEEELLIGARYPNVSPCNHNGLPDKIADLLAVWKAPVRETDYFGLRTEQEIQYLCRNLDIAYRANAADGQEEGIELGAIDQNHRVLSEALRLRLLPSSELKGEFDDIVRKLESVRTNLKLFEAATYEQESAKIASFNETQRRDFYEKLLHATGSVPCQGGIRKIEVGRGESNYGFAIDTVTLETQITKGFGLHEMAVRYLDDRLDYMRRIMIHRHLIEENSDDNREILDGTVINDVPGFQTPILRLNSWQASKDGLARVISHIKNKKQHIPVTGDGKLIEV